MLRVVAFMRTTWSGPTADEALSAQRKAIETWCAANNAQIVARVTHQGNEVYFQNAVDQVKRLKADGVVVSTLNRLGRQASAAHILCQKAGRVFTADNGEVFTPDNLRAILLPHAGYGEPLPLKPLRRHSLSQIEPLFAPIVEAVEGNQAAMQALLPVMREFLGGPDAETQWVVAMMDEIAAARSRQVVAEWVDSGLPAALVLP